MCYVTGLLIVIPDALIVDLCQSELFLCCWWLTYALQMGLNIFIVLKLRIFLRESSTDIYFFQFFKIFLLICIPIKYNTNKYEIEWRGMNRVWWGAKGYVICFNNLSVSYVLTVSSYSYSFDIDSRRRIDFRRRKVYIRYVHNFGLN